MQDKCRRTILDRNAVVTQIQKEDKQMQYFSTNDINVHVMIQRHFLTRKNLVHVKLR